LQEKGPDTQENGADKGEDAGPDYDVITININGLFRGRLEQNVFVEPGDIVTIPPADIFYVAGEVKAPGSFQLKDGTTVRQAIALAQGPTENAKTGEGFIFREDALGKRQEIKVDIGAIMKGRKEDIPLQANDLVMVPNSRGKTIGNAILKAFGLGAAQRGIPRY
jgi:polysaccharide export outer membrane protein